MKDRSVVVVGAGISGLLVAYFAAKRGHRVSVHEKASRVGGLLHTRQTPWGLVETAANGLLKSKSLELLLQDIGLSIEPTQKASRRRFIFAGGRIRRWPLNFKESLAFGSGIVRAFMNAKAHRPRPGESVAEWTKQKLGRAALEKLVGPALGGIYAGDVKRMSASLIFGRLFKTEKSKSRSQGSKGTVGFRLGMGEFTEKLYQHLLSQGVEFHFGSHCQMPERPHAPHVVCVGAHQLSEAFGGRLPAAFRSLDGVEMLPIVSVTQFCTSGPLMNGFGCLFADGEGFRALGVLMNSQIFSGRARQGLQSETWILGGVRSAELVGKSDDEIVRALTADRQRLGGQGEVLHREITRWPQALPHYTVDWESRLARIDEAAGARSGFFLCGNYLGQIGLSAVLARAEQVVERLEEFR